MKKVFYLLLKLTFVALIVGVLIAGYQFIGHEVISASKYLLNSKNLIWISTILCSVLLLVGLMLLNKRFPGFRAKRCGGAGTLQYNPFQRFLVNNVCSEFS